MNYRSGSSPDGTIRRISSYEKNYLLVSIFNIGDIFLVKEYLVAVRFADMKEIISTIKVLKKNE